jgi:hypothetical protein
MGILEQIHNLTNSALPSSHAAYHKWRGVVLPTDIFLTGSVRFARKIGGVLPTILPFNYAELSQDVAFNARSIFFKTFPTPSISLGTILRMNRRERVIVEDFNEDNNEVYLTRGVQATYVADTPVEVYAQPIEADGSYTAATTTINVDSEWKIYPGDVLVFGFTEIGVTLATETAFVGGVYSYQVILESGIPTDIDDGDEVLLRAYPAYESEVRTVPTSAGVLTGAGIGPFVLDWVSGTLVTSPDIEETMYVYLLTSAGTVIQEGVFNKNDLVLRAPLRADYPLFWNVERGSINWNGTLFRATTDDRGKFHVFKKLVPHFPTDQVNQWNIQVTNNSGADVTVFTELEPNPKQTHVVPDGGITTISVLLDPADQPAERVHLRVDSGSNAGAHIWFGNWNLITPRVETLRYHVVARTSGEFNYACSGLMVKPYFLTIDYLTARLDYGGVLDGGRLLL